MTLVALAAGLVALTATGCTKSAEQYAAPSELCGIPVDPAVLRPVLLPGEKLTTSPANSDAATRRCGVLVDGERVFALESRVAPANENYRATWDWQMPQATTVAIGDEGRATDTLVAAARKCAVKGEERVFLARAERFYPKKDDTAERKEALVRFMTAYFPTAQKTAGCTG
ncbi:hypothetical protein [Streptomyces sp. NPDC058326]|uniref:hypothetical protein n=1 Tax=Streptomyces sp. NPDC058326 TaxID=3346447 RepID=UPI0036E14392